MSSPNITNNRYTWNGQYGFRASTRLKNLGLQQVKALVNAKDQFDLLTPVPQITGKTKDDAPGTDSARDISIDRYKPVWQDFRDFCFVIGDYESAIIVCRDLCPYNPPTVNHNTAILFLRFRVLLRGTELTHPTTSESVKDVDGQPLTSLGDWKGASTIGIARSALSKLHSHHRGTKARDYVEPCPACVRGDCNEHTEPQTKATGNITFSREFSTAVTSLMDYAVKHYPSRQHFALLPSDVRSLLDKLISHNSPLELMYATMTLFGIAQFRRVEEVLELKVEDFKPLLSVLTESEIHGLVFDVNGKRDPMPVPLAMWFHKKCRDLCALRLMLIWLCVSGIKSGYIFPSAGTLDAIRRNGGHSDRPIQYAEVIQKYKYLFSEILLISVDEQYIIGTHFLRYTAFLFAYWGFMQMQRFRNGELNDFDKADLMGSARHKDITQTLRYVQDAGTLLRVKSFQKDSPREAVEDWFPIHIHNERAYRRLNINSSRLQKGLIEIAEMFVYDKLGFPRGLHGFTIQDLWLSARNFDTSIDLSKETELFSILQQNLQPTILESVTKLFKETISVRMHECLQTRPIQSTPAAMAQPPVGAAALLLPPPPLPYTTPPLLLPPPPSLPLPPTANPVQFGAASLHPPQPPAASFPPNPAFTTDYWAPPWSPAAAHFRPPVFPSRPLARPLAASLMPPTDTTTTETSIAIGNSAGSKRARVESSPKVFVPLTFRACDPTETRMRVICSAVDKMVSVARNLDSKSRRKLYHYFPVVDCFRKCYQGDLSDFVLAYPELNPTKFKCLKGQDKSHKHSMSESEVESTSASEAGASSEPAREV